MPKILLSSSVLFLLGVLCSFHSSLFLSSLENFGPHLPFVTRILCYYPTAHHHTWYGRRDIFNMGETDLFYVYVLSLL